MDVMQRKDAKNLNLNKYYTGVACINGHVAERYTTSGACSACVTASNNTRTGQTPEQAIARRLTMSQLAEIKIRAYPHHWPTVRDTAAACVLGRHPGLTLADVTSNRPGSDNDGGTLMYRVLVDPADIKLVHDTARALLNTVKVDTTDVDAYLAKKMAEAIEPAPKWSERP